MPRRPLILSLAAAALLAAALHAAAYGPPGFMPVSYGPHPGGYGNHAPRAVALHPPQRPAPAPAAATPPADASAPPRAVKATEVERIPADLTRETPVSERKRRFLAILTPLVLLENRRIEGLRREAVELVETLEGGAALTDAKARRLAALARDFRVDGDPARQPAARADLLARVDTIPVSLALAQAANESAWGSSRFAREAQNLFGIWTYDPAKGVVPRRRAAGKKHLVRRFDSLRDSVRYYMHTLNSHPAYAELRERRARLRADGVRPTGMALSAGLEPYSAKGEAYVRIIRQMIEDNALAALEDARLAG